MQRRFRLERPRVQHVERETSGNAQNGDTPELRSESGKVLVELVPADEEAEEEAPVDLENHSGGHHVVELAKPGTDVQQDDLSEGSGAPDRDSRLRSEPESFEE